MESIFVFERDDVADEILSDPFLAFGGLMRAVFEDEQQKMAEDHDAQIRAHGAARQAQSDAHKAQRTQAAGRDGNAQDRAPVQSI